MIYAVIFIIVIFLEYRLCEKTSNRKEEEEAGDKDQ